MQEIRSFRDPDESGESHALCPVESRSGRETYLEDCHPHGYPGSHWCELFLESVCKRNGEEGLCLEAEPEVSGIKDTGYGEICPSAFLGKRIWGDGNPGEDLTSENPTDLWKTTDAVPKEEPYRIAETLLCISIPDGHISKKTEADPLCSPFRYPKTGSSHPADGIFAKRRDQYQGRAGGIPETFGGTGSFLDEGTKDAIPKRSRWYAHSGDQQGSKRTSEKDPFQPADRSPVERDGRTIQKGKGTGTGTGNVRETTKGRRTEAVRR